MRRLMAMLVGLAVAVVALASPAMANTTTPVSMTFTEPVVPSADSGCARLIAPYDGFCGSGIVLPYGHATETVAFGAGCGGDCDLRTVDLAAGSIVMEELGTIGSECSRCHDEHGGPWDATLKDVVVGGTGAFAGASGALSGTVEGTGLHAIVRLSGTLTLP
jgi:hypothetical protein